MVDRLIRGVPPETLTGIREYAKKHDLSLNQALIQIIKRAIDRIEAQKRTATLRAKADQRLRKMQGRGRRKYDFDEPE